MDLSRDKYLDGLYIQLVLPRTNLCGVCLHIPFGSSPIGLDFAHASRAVALHGFGGDTCDSLTTGVIETIILTVVEHSSRPRSLTAFAIRIVPFNPLQLGAAPGNQSDSQL